MTRPRHGGRVLQRSAVIYCLLIAGAAIAAETNILPFYARGLLDAGGTPVLLGFPLGMFVVFAPPMVFARWCSRGGWGRSALLPAFVLVHSLVVWLGVRVGAPLGAIHDLLGAPVLGWPWELELMGRFVALSSAVSVLFVGGAHLAASIAGPHVDRDRSALRRWAVPAVLLLAVSYWVAVRLAATYTLVELMAGSGSVLSAVCLCAWVLNVAVSSSSLAAVVRRRAHTIAAGVVMVAGIAIGLVTFALGTAHSVFRGGEVSSAMQILFSAYHGRPASGTGSLIRYFFSYFGLVIAVAMVQMPFAGHRQVTAPAAAGEVSPGAASARNHSRGTR